MDTKNVVSLSLGFLRPEKKMNFFLTTGHLFFAWFIFVGATNGSTGQSCHGRWQDWHRFAGVGEGHTNSNLSIMKEKIFSICLSFGLQTRNEKFWIPKWSATVFGVTHITQKVLLGDAHWTNIWSSSDPPPEQRPMETISLAGGTPTAEHKQIAEPDQLGRMPLHGTERGKHLAWGGLAVHWDGKGWPVLYGWRWRERAAQGFS